MYIAKRGFSGAIIMRKGEVREIKDKNIIKDLMNAGYIEEYKASTPKELKEEIKTLKKELEDANATIEELNKKIEELQSTKEDPEENSEENSDGKVE